MPTRSVLDIEVNDQQFKDFQANFEKYQKLLSATPTAWAKVSKENAAVSKQFETMAAALMAQNSLTHDNAKAEKDRADQLKKSSTEWEKISRFTGVAAGNVLKIGGYLLKWGTILGGGLLGGSLFGLDKIGGGVSRERQSAMGLGLTIGQQKSFEVNFGRFVNPGAFLGGVNAAVTDVTQQGPLSSLGVNPNGSTEQVALATLKAVRELARATPINQLGTLLSSRHLDQSGFTAESLRTVRDDPSFGKQFGLYGQGAQAFNIDPKTALMWTDFNTKLSAAGEKIFKVLVGGLGPLAGPIGKLSDAFTNLLEHALKKDGPIEHGIENIAKWINEFSTTLAKPEFVTSMQGFISDMGDIASSMHDLAHPIDALGNKFANPVSNWFGGVASAWSDHMTGANGEYDKYLATLEGTMGLPAGLLQRQTRQEDPSGDPNAVSPKGAIGRFQFMPDTARQWGVNAHDQWSSAQGGARLDSYLLSKYHNDLAKALAAYNAGEGRVDAATASGNPRWLGSLPAETQRYVAGIGGRQTALNAGAQITILDKTGGSVNVAASQLSVLGPIY